MMQRMTPAVLLLATTLASAPAVHAQPIDDAPAGNPYRRSDLILAVTLGIGALHHLDHFISEGHPDFPFGAHSLPLTASLAVYPLFLGGHYLELGPNYSITLDAVVLALVTFAHHFDKHDPLSEHYNKWGDTGPPPDGVGPERENLLGVESRVLGGLSVTIALGLEAALATHLISSILDGREHGFTWKRRKAAPRTGTSVAVVPCTDQLCLGLAGRW